MTLIGLILCGLLWSKDLPDVRYSVAELDFISAFGSEPDEAQLRRQLNEVLAIHEGLQVRDASGEVRQQAGQLSGPSLMSLIVILTKPTNLGLEVDLVVPFEGSRFLVTVWWDDAKRIRVAQREVRGALQPTATLEEVRALGVTVVEGPVPWEPEVLGALKQAYSLLPAEDRRYLGRVEFLRVREPDETVRTLLPVLPESGIAAMFRLDRGPGQIEVYDGGLGSTATFVGSQERPISVMARSLLHELGHALASKTVLSYNVRVTRANGLVLEYNRRAADFNARREESSKSDRKELEAMSQELELLNERLLQAQAEVGPPILDGSKRSITAVAAAMLNVAPRAEVVTRYGRQHPEEGFAEVFAMFWADSAALKRVSPKLYAWMQSGDWRHELAKPLVDWR